MIDLPHTSVLYMGPFSGWGARERGLVREARQAKMTGVHVVICCPLESYVHLEAKKHGIETFPIRAVKPNRWFGAYRDVFNFLHKRHRLTHFHCYDDTSLFSSALFLRRHPEVALVWSIHGTPPSIGARFWQRILLGRIDRFLLPSSLSVSDLSNKYGVSAHKIARVGLAIDSRELAWQEPNRDEGFMIGVSLPDNTESIEIARVALIALNLVHAKGIADARLLLHTPRDWHASIWREQLEQLIISAGLEAHVDFISGEDFTFFVSRLHMNLAAEGEEVPYDQIETCLLAAIPVVHPRNRAYRELLHEIDAGLFSYKPGDARELALKILELHEHWEKSCRAMQGVRAEHGRLHDPGLVREQLQQVYERTMLRRGKYWRKLGRGFN